MIDWDRHLIKTEKCSRIGADRQYYLLHGSDIAKVDGRYVLANCNEYNCPEVTPNGVRHFNWLLDTFYVLKDELVLYKKGSRIAVWCMAGYVMADIGITICLDYANSEDICISGGVLMGHAQRGRCGQSDFLRMII